MTKKHYIAIAKILSNNNPDRYNNDNKPNFQELINDLSNYFYADNPNFDFKKFSDAIIK